ncbi:MAG: hypothetical protein HKP28_08300, partial [Winogradskyella sp.]|nr:hypothetical protein [Winogradskyella sp.]
MKFWESSASHVVRAVTKLPYLSLLLIFIVMALMSLPISRLAVDASPDSLLLENDPDLKFYRAIHDEYGTDVYMIVAVRLNDSIFARSSINKIEVITKQFRNIEDVSNVTSITTVPLIYQSLDEKEETEINFPTIMSKGVDINEAEIEFLTNPLYERNIVSEDLKIAAFKIDFQDKPEYKELFDQRYLLIDKRETSGLNRKERKNFASINKRLEQLRKIDNKRIETALKEIRNILDANKKTLESYISGAPLIAHDMKHYVLKDIKVFGIAAIIAMAIILFV